MWTLYQDSGPVPPLGPDRRRNRTPLRGGSQEETRSLPPTSSLTSISSFRLLLDLFSINVPPTLYPLPGPWGGLSRSLVTPLQPHRPSLPRPEASSSLKDCRYCSFSCVPRSRKSVFPVPSSRLLLLPYVPTAPERRGKGKETLRRTTEERVPVHRRKNR